MKKNRYYSKIKMYFDYKKPVDDEFVLTISGSSETKKYIELILGSHNTVTFKEVEPYNYKVTIHVNILRFVIKDFKNLKKRWPRMIGFSIYNKRNQWKKMK